MKFCPGCKLSLSLDMFFNNVRRKDGKDTACKPCVMARRKEKRANDPEGHKAKEKVYRDRHKLNNPERSREQFRASHLKRLYGLTIEQYDAMLGAQDGVCAACKAPPKDKNLAVDHDHACCPGKKSCGKCIRMLLCDVCNKVLGLTQDDPDHLTALADYLSRSRFDT